MLVSNLYHIQSRNIFHTDVLKAYFLQILFQTINFWRVWRRTQSCLDRSRYRKQANLCSKMMSDARRRYYADCINETSDNPPALCKTINNMLHKTQSQSIPAFWDIKLYIKYINFLNRCWNFSWPKSRKYVWILPTTFIICRTLNLDSKIMYDLFWTGYCWWSEENNCKFT